MPHTKSLVVIGGGSAGFFCGVNAARMNPLLKVIILEKGNKLMSKVKISGGGRCNVTHACFDIAAMSRNYPRGSNFVKKTFHRFFTTDTIKWFEDRSVKLKTETDGRMFPVTNTSQTVIDCLLQEANTYGVEIRMKSEVKNLKSEGRKFRIEFSNHNHFTSDIVCISSGGYPKSDLFGWLKELGHTIEEPVPSLFTFNLPKHPITKLMGVSIEKAKVKIAGTKLEQKGPLLITHWGLSGPAVLKLSAFAAKELAIRQYDFTAVINWLPDINEQSLKERFNNLRNAYSSQKIHNRNPFGLPSRLWVFLAQHSGATTDMRWADLPSVAQDKFIKNLCSYDIEVRGKTTFKEEFVTAGGIKLSEVDANTMMSKKISNLFFAGEVLDVDGITGGYNFQHAWTSGWIAASSIAGEAL